MKKILFSAMAILLSLGLIGAAFASFSDTEESTGNTFEAGTLDLVMGGDWETGSTIVMSNMKTGDSKSVSITYTNIGTLVDGLAVWSFDYIELDGTELTAEYTDDMSEHDVAKALYVSSIMWNDGTGEHDMTVDWTAYGGSKDGDSTNLTVYDLKAVTDDGGMDWVDPTAMAQNATHTLSLTITFDPQRTIDSGVPLDTSISDFPAVNAFQNDGINGTISIFLPQ